MGQITPSPDGGRRMPVANGDLGTRRYLALPVHSPGHPHWPLAKLGLPGADGCPLPTALGGCCVDLGVPVPPRVPRTSHPMHTHAPGSLSTCPHTHPDALSTCPHTHPDVLSTCPHTYPDTLSTCPHTHTDGPGWMLLLGANLYYTLLFFHSAVAGGCCCAAAASYSSRS